MFQRELVEDVPSLLTILIIASGFCVVLSRLVLSVVQCRGVLVLKCTIHLYSVKIHSVIVKNPVIEDSVKKL